MRFGKISYVRAKLSRTKFGYGCHQRHLNGMLVGGDEWECTSKNRKDGPQSRARGFRNLWRLKHAVDFFYVVVLGRIGHEQDLADGRFWSRVDGKFRFGIGGVAIRSSA